jgi:hypothetical protein
MERTWNDNRNARGKGVQMSNRRPTTSFNTESRIKKKRSNEKTSCFFPFRFLYMDRTLINTQMGSKKYFSCSKCKYTVLTSGGPDSGMRAATDTYCCKDCRILMDLFVESGSPGHPFPDVVLTKTDLKISGSLGSAGRCKQCQGLNITLWDNKLRPCPKCDTGMESDGFRTMLWD